MKKSINNLVS
jgi:hypothetical protein